MLKRLELSGFKSFADRTRFEFPEGITAIVGPNGSGKSNIVDAVRWVLGEQSAKSLRGDEMTDVIFNGTGTRKSLPFAEVRLLFDNSRGLLNTHATELEITRRVHRDGTSEYLLNGQTSRLKDIRETLLGSGTGNSSYCIIEQGRVDAILQANGKERRLIFEEAAGITKFRNKKNEALKKLEATSQNLDRVKDIQQELERQLKKLRQEANKAERYQTLQRELRRLQVHHAVVEYDRNQKEIQGLLQSQEQLKGTLTQADAASVELRGEAQRLTQQLDQLREQFNHTERQLAELRSQAQDANRQCQRYAGETQTLNESIAQFQAEMTETIRQQREAIQRLHTQEKQLAEVDQALSWLKDQNGQHNARQQQLDQLERSLKTELTRLREQEFELFQAVTRVENEERQWQSNQNRLQNERQRLLKDRERCETEIQALSTLLSELDSETNSRQDLLSHCREQLQREQQTAVERGTEKANLLQKKTDAQMQLGSIQTQIKLMQDWEAENQALPRMLPIWRELYPDQFLGLIADLLEVPLELAPVVDAILREKSQACLIADLDWFRKWQQEQNPESLTGLAVLPLAKSTSSEGYIDFAGVVRVRLPQFRPLIPQLFGHVKLVDDLQTAWQHWPDCRSKKHTLATRQGHLLQPDSTLHYPVNASQRGLVSRKSELRNWQQKQLEWSARLTHWEHDWDTLLQAEANAQQIIQRLIQEEKQLELQLEASRRGKENQAARLLQLQDNAELLIAELAMNDSQAQSLEQELSATRAKLLQASQSLAHCKDQQKQIDTELAQCAADQTIERDLRLEIQTKLAETQAHRDASERELNQQQAAIERTNISKDKLTLQKQRAANHRARVELEWLNTQQVYALAITRQEKLNGERSYLNREQTRHQHSWEAITAQIETSQAAFRQDREQLHKVEMQLTELQSKHQAITAKLQEDWSLSLETLARLWLQDAQWLLEFPLELQNEEKQQMEKFRAELKKIGPISLDSIAERDALQKRLDELNAQVRDLVEARKNLLEIIETINQQSVKALLQTIQTVKQHFSGIFQSLFGGGEGEIVIEDPENILESNLEIVARPPGKALRSITLMSGGEKTLTVVALLLAIFRANPAPFCLLDEVDAALDEANTQRLANALKEFVSQSQFLVITHKKRTMAVADVLYGVTMQESGVSRQISIRFDDWTDADERQASQKPVEKPKRAA